MTRRHGLVVGVAAAVMMAAGVITGTVAVVSITAAAKDRETRGDRRIVGAVAGIVAVADIVIRVRIVVANAGITRCRITHTCDGVAVGVNHTRGEGETADGGTG
jgi:hypothetical protein